MLYNFKLLEFYKDLQAFVSGHLLGADGALQRVNDLMHSEHKVD